MQAGSDFVVPVKSFVALDQLYRAWLGEIWKPPVFADPGKPRDGLPRVLVEKAALVETVEDGLLPAVSFAAIQGQK